MAFPATDTARGRHRYWRAAALAGVCLAAIWCYAPALHAYFMQDDFLLLALARMVHQPLQVFYHDHFPGSLFFRPLGIFIWWLTTAAFERAPYGQYAANLALHLGVVFALYTLLQRLRRDAPLNAAWTAAFAVHPVAIGTALWLSDRFDLIATAFSLVALSAAIAYVQRPRAGAMAAVLVFLLLAFAGKEIAIVGALAACALIALPNRDWPLTPMQRWPAVAAILLLVCAWLVYRAALMTNPQNSLLHADSLVATFAKGIALWFRVGYDYFVVDPRQAAWMTALQALGAVPIVLAIIVTARDGNPPSRAYGLVAAIAILLLLPGPTQAPVVSIFVSAVGAARGWFYMAIESRLYHISLAGLIAALMLLTTQAVSAAPDRRFSRVDCLVAAGLALMMAAWIPASHALAHDYASHTREQVGPLQAAHTAIARLDLPSGRCQIYLLDATSLWGFADSGDATIKATAPDLGRLEHCLVLTERTPWGNFIRAGSIGDFSPLRVLTHEGTPVPWLVLGDFELAYLDLDAAIDARSIDGAVFLEYRDGTFHDVSADVRSGARPVHFFNARPDQK
jgi:hypothetical protein